MARAQAISHIGAGVDIENIARFEKLDRRKHRRFLERIFTRDELAYCFAKKNPSPHLAARFCGKEAVIKALASFGVRAVPYYAVEILHNTSGMPKVILPERYKYLAVQISLSHARDYAIAVSIVQRYE